MLILGNLGLFFVVFDEKSENGVLWYWYDFELGLLFGLIVIYR